MGGIGNDLKVDFNEVLERTDLVLKVKKLLKEFNDKKHDLSVKRGIYVYGSPGCGKTEFVLRLLADMSYDTVRYDAGDIRNKSVIETITKHNMSDQSVMSIFEKTPKRIAVVMDEIDGMNTGDKGGITSLIKLIRPKKTKKQKSEDYTMNPIICIGNYDMDKKIKEIMKVCHVIEIPAPTHCQMRSLIGEAMPAVADHLIEKIARFTQCDIRKFMLIYEIYAKNSAIITDETLDTIFKPKSCSETSKVIVNRLFKNRYSIAQHTSVISETDRTIIGLLWHENVVDRVFHPRNAYTPQGAEFYEQILKNICFADYIDRITFQKQIWIFNEMSSLIKTFYNNDLYGDFRASRVRGGGNHVHHLAAGNAGDAADIRFTKVLTKYSTEYNNILFIQHMCNELLMDKKDIIEFFNRIKCDKNDEALNACCEQHEITRLDVDRMFRYIDKCFTPPTVQLGLGSATSADAGSAEAKCDDDEYDLDVGELSFDGSGGSGAGMMHMKGLGCGLQEMDIGAMMESDEMESGGMGGLGGCGGGGASKSSRNGAASKRGTATCTKKNNKVARVSKLVDVPPTNSSGITLKTKNQKTTK
jgi:DNA polymerase III delta prime subunit